MSSSRIIDRCSRRARVGDLSSHHEQQWRLLWQEYLTFYAAHLPEAVTDSTWSLLTATRSDVFGLAAEADGQLAGFAHVILHPRTWTAGHTAYLEDLYVSRNCRRSGIATALISQVFARAAERSCSSVYWHTSAQNVEARALYDRWARSDDFVRYRVQLSDGLVPNLVAK